METIMFLLSVFGAFGIFVMLARKTSFLAKKPFTCALCMGFWIALAIQAAERLVPSFGCVSNALAAAGAVWALNKAVTGES